MIFKIDPPGTDYTRVTLDVPHDQLTDVIHAVTTAHTTASDASRDVLHGESTGGCVARAPWRELTRAERAKANPTCRWCGLGVDMKDRRTADGGVYVVDTTTEDVVTACRGCASSRDNVESLQSTVTRWGRDEESELRPVPTGRRVPTGVGEHEVMGVGQPFGHGVLPVVVDGLSDDCVEGGIRHRAQPDPDHLAHSVALGAEVLQPEAGGVGVYPGPGEAQEEADVRVCFGGEAKGDRVSCEGDAKGDRVIVHGCSSCGCRCAGAAGPDGTGDAEPTRVEALLEELLAEVRAHAPKLWLTVRGSAAFERNVGGLDSDDAQAPDEGPDCGERGDAL